MLKKIFLFLTIPIILSSCVITEDVYFAENGSAKYNFSLDMSEMMKDKKGDDFNGVNNNDTISVAKFLRDSIGDMEMPEKYANLLKELEPFYLNPKIDNENKTFIVNIFGNFDDLNQLNKGVIALNQAQELGQYLKKKKRGENVDEESEDMNFAVGRIAQYTQDGNAILRNYIDLSPSAAEEEAIEVEEEDETTEEEQGFVTKLASGMANGLMEQMLSLGTYNINYHFYKPVSSIEGKHDTLSEDKKTITFSMPGMMFLNPELEGIKIKLAD